MHAATIDNVKIGGSWTPVLDHSCGRAGSRGGAGGALSLTIDYTAETQRFVHVYAEVSWSTVRGRATAVMDVPATVNLGATCVAVRARAIGDDEGADVSVSAQLVRTLSLEPTRPRFTERVPATAGTTIAPVPHWARQLDVRSVNLYGQYFTWLELYGDELASDLITRSRLIEPTPIFPSARWRRFANVDADLSLVWTLGL